MASFSPLPVQANSDVANNMLSAVATRIHVEQAFADAEAKFVVVIATSFARLVDRLRRMPANR